MKTKRHAKILEIINNHDVGTQEELCDWLNQEGYQVTQATVSRDIRELKLTKVASADGRQKYTLFEENKGRMQDKFNRIFREGTVSIETAQNLLVIRTVSGMAMAVAAALDAMNKKEIVGSIAGDDTIMCAVKTASKAEELKEDLEQILLDV